MDEYISREEMIDKLKMRLAELEADKNKGYIDELYENKGAREAVECCIAEIETLPSADVQPVPQWISVNDKLPENAKPCAVVTEDNGLGVSRYMGRNRFEWTLFGELVLYWMPLPEPPKDGDAE